MATRTYKGLKIRDAKSPMKVPVIQADWDMANAERAENVNDAANFNRCVIAQAINRVFGELEVTIERTRAFVPSLKAGYAERYVVPEEARDILAEFDRGVEVQPGTVIELQPPSKSETLKERRKSEARARRKRKAKTGTTHRAKSPQPKTADPLNGIVRNGHYVRF